MTTYIFSSTILEEEFVYNDLMPEEYKLLAQLKLKPSDIENKLRCNIQLLPEEDSYEKRDKYNYHNFVL